MTIQLSGASASLLDSTAHPCISPLVNSRRPGTVCVLSAHRVGLLAIG